MKRKIALFLTIIMLCTVMLPLQSFAAKDNGLEKAITTVKGLFKISDSYTFTPESYMDNGKKIWSLSWNSKNGTDGNINVRIDEKGTILSYDSYKPYDYSSRKLPKVSRQEAQRIAEAFVNKVNPGILAQTRLTDNNQNTLMDYTYYFNFTRLVKDIPFYNNNISVSVNRETGEVQSYYYNWNDDYVFPDASKAIKPDVAEKAYTDKLGLKLIYKYSYENDQVRLYTVYTPNYNDLYAIDALTGEKVRIDNGFYGGMGGPQAAFTTSEKAADASNVVLTPEETKAVEDMSKLKTQEEAEKIAREFKPVNLTADFKLTNYNLTKSWPIRSEYMWNLSFSKETSDNKDNAYAGVTINAKTGEIMSFYRNTNYNDTDKAKYNEAQAKQAVEDFLKSNFPDKFKDVQYDENYNYYPMYKSGTEEPKYFNFNYVRKVNNATFPDNNISVGFDAVNGEVTNFNMSWFDITFPALDKAISIDKAYEKLFSDIGLELQYKASYSQENYYKPIMPPNTKPEIKLVYSLKPGKPQFLDANSGVILDYNGKPYKENKPVVYTDIKGHSAEKQISVLSEFGISLEGSKFMPDEKITQLDFLTLLSKTLNSYYGPVISPNGTAIETDEFYKNMIALGIIKEAEKSPKSDVTKEDAVKFIIRALKYDKVADIKGIYKCSFKDANKIDPNLIGYVAIAEGLKIVNGTKGYLNPKTNITRAQAAIMIYNYLQG